MSNEDQMKADVSANESSTPDGKTKELSNEELKSVSGGLKSTLGVTQSASDDGGCITAL